MSASATLTVRLPTNVKRRLGRLARSTKRTQSFLAGAAIADLVERESAIAKRIAEGLEDAKRGRVVPHEEVVEEIEALLRRSGRRKRRR